jgi:hypothetical protein
VLNFCGLYRSQVNESLSRQTPAVELIGSVGQRPAKVVLPRFHPVTVALPPVPKPNLIVLLGFLTVTAIFPVGNVVLPVCKQPLPVCFMTLPVCKNVLPVCFATKQVCFETLQVSKDALQVSKMTKQVGKPALQVCFVTKQVCFTIKQVCFDALPAGKMALPTVLKLHQTGKTSLSGRIRPPLVRNVMATSEWGGLPADCSRASFQR